MGIRVKILLTCFLSFLVAHAQKLSENYIMLADSADYYIEKKMWTDAENAIIRALKLEPANKSNFLLWSNLGIVRENQNNYDGAIQAYTIGLSSAPKSTVLLTNRARAYLADNKPHQALDDLETTLQADSTLQWPLKMKGLILASLEDNDEALEVLGNYRNKYGKDSSVSEALGDIEARRGNCEASIAYYDEALENNDDADLLVKMLLTAYSYGKIEDMGQQISNGIRKYPRLGTLYLIRAMLHKANYQTDAYESDLKSAINFGVDKELYDFLTRK